MTLTLGLDYASAFVFALTGALAASRAQLDIVGFIFFGALTAVGGGTLRDLLLDRDPVFWIADPTPLGIAALAAVLVFFTAHLLESRLKWIIWLDAAALAIAVAAGVAVARSLEASAPVVLVMGVATGTFGGLARDVIANEVPLVLRQGELYVTAAFGGAAATLLGVRLLAVDPIWATAICVVVTFGLRAGSLLFGWSLPVYKARPPRS
ncbi:trimeric intracellular cation channel family protein [Gymnodinialimonas ulvae]|uniref:trimeric intracellular cation channel family protein n=1 Tax=Gymnodinialimonas ulvae TaxID=3126504 RepID=UPI00309A28A7